MRRTRANGTLRFLSRLLVSLVIVVVVTLISIQYARIIHENIAMAQSLAAINRDVRDLRLRRVQQQREIRRLLDPQGAVPEIHERLHLVGKNEAIIYMKPAAHR